MKTPWGPDSQMVTLGIRVGISRQVLWMRQLRLALPGRPPAAGQHPEIRERSPTMRTRCGHGARRVFTRPPPPSRGVALVQRSLREGNHRDEAAGGADPCGRRRSGRHPARLPGARSERGRESRVGYHRLPRSRPTYPDPDVSSSLGNGVGSEGRSYWPRSRPHFGFVRCRTNPQPARSREVRSPHLGHV